MTKYRRKPTEIEAVQWEGHYSSFERAHELGATLSISGANNLHLMAGKNQAQGWVEVPVGHWIAKASDDDFYPIDPDVFAQTYEAVDGD